MASIETSDVPQDIKGAVAFVATPHSDIDHFMKELSGDELSSFALVEDRGDVSRDMFEDHKIHVLGHTAILERKKSGGKHMGDPPREHHLMRLALDDYQHRVWKTDPVEGEANGTAVVVKLGLSQIIERGLGEKFHIAIAKKMPGATVYSHATHGVGPTAERLHWHNPARALHDLKNQGLEYMASQGLNLAKAIEEKKKLFIGISMGTVVLHKLAKQNMTDSEPVDISGLIYYDPALVPPERVVKDMGRDFLPSLSKDGIKELLLRTHPAHWFEQLATIRNSHLDLNDIPFVIRQSLDLLHGTPVREIEHVAAAYPMSVISGLQDSLNEHEMWQAINKKMPWVDLEFLPGMGHAMPANAVKGAEKVVSSAIKIGAYKNRVA